jgi:DNA/RNA endonuclease G (NUC1)/S1-C subfamily serine protease
MNGKPEKVKRFVEWVAAPRGGLESMAGESPLLEGIDETPWATEPEVEHARAAVARLERDEPLTEEQAGALEAIVLPRERPVVDVVNGSFTTPDPPFQHLGGDVPRRIIEAAIGSIGRIELPDHPSLPYGGTGFVVGDGVLMTNRHVAELFALGIGREELSFRPGQSAAIDFLRERGRDETRQFRIARVVMIHPYWDMALLVVEGLRDVRPLHLSVAPPGDLQGREIAVIGYPALDPRNNVDLQNRIFRGVFNVKRLQPGKLRQAAEIGSFGHDVSAITHDSSTLGGNSGSALVDVADGSVVGLHFAGRYLEANFAVPTHELALDGRVVDAGVNFEDQIVGTATSWDGYWREADPSGRELATVTDVDERGAAAVGGAISVQSGGLSWSIPLEVDIQIRSPAAPQASASAPAAEVEAMVEPFRDLDFSDRTGYDAEFLGVHVSPPTVVDESLVSRLDDGSHLLPYEHFSIVLNKNRRLALFTVSNVDAAEARKEPEPGHDYSRKGLSGLGKNDKEKWFTDPRIPAAHQLPDRFYSKDRTSFDKGHIVRREDVAWGDSFDEVRRANGDTYHVTNCSPQVAAFNQAAKDGLWGQLEKLILDQAESERYSLFAGPVFGPDDPLFRGVDDEGAVLVRIPRRFWKIVVAQTGDDVATFAFILEQDLSRTDLEFAVDEEWRERMISVPKLEALLAELTFPPKLHESDQFGTESGESLRARTGLESFSG